MAGLIKVKVDSKAVTKMLEKAAKQIPFAISRALNETAKLARDRENAAMPSVFNHASLFTQKAVEVSAFSTKTNLTATVGIKPLQAHYLGLEILGGTRTPADNTRLPSQALAIIGKGGDALPSGMIKRLARQVQTAQANREAIAAGTRTARKGAGSRGVFKLTGHDPFNDGGVGGFWRRLPDSKLTRLVSFDPKARYTPKFSFGSDTEAVVKQNFERLFEQQLAKALQTAK